MRTANSFPNTSSLLLKGIVLIVISCALFISSCHMPTAKKSFDKATEIALVEKAIHGSIGWAKDKDFNLLYSIIANDSSYMEIHPEGRVVKGFANFKKAEAFWGSSDFKAIRYELSDLTINLSASGEIAWFYCKLDDINEWKGQPANWENARWTGVLEKRDGRWQMFQMHFSYACDEGKKQ